jgi:hypothetical protein
MLLAYLTTSLGPITVWLAVLGITLSVVAGLLLHVAYQVMRLRDETRAQRSTQ